ncbi:FAD-dependent oxidoreductase [Amnibacterium endophyticum]|uniref:FAD-dependent oxidoreductase n=1 Tax=Amnibacterium endophyticum TaxID=2109337 RepID=A0ABW4LG21_9MICO
MSATAVAGGGVARADARLGAVPMVRLVLAALAVVALAALVGSATGLVPFPLPGMLAVLAVAVGVTWGTGRIAAVVVRSPAHDESALVTGLLLFLILPPSLEPGALGAAALVAAVATASKYLIRIGGRHVLNPAAAGLLLVGLTGLPVGAWWVGTPALLPVTAIAAVVIARRMRLLVPVGVLVVAGTACIAAASALAGFYPAEAARTALLSGPLVFLAGTMFTEPVTLPPRAGQRIAEALVVAVLLALPWAAPIHVGTLAPTPELALVVGNVLAAVLARPVAARLRLAGSRRLTPTAVEYAFTPDRPLGHRAGQYLELHLPHRGADRRGVRRSLTIVSPPDPEDGRVRVAVRTRPPGSTFKRALDALPVGAELRAVTVTGGFTLPDDRGAPLVLVASGIGLTPFVSQLAHGARQVAGGAPPRDVQLVVRVPAADEVAYLPELAATGVPVLLVAPDPAALPPLPEGWRAVRDVAEALDAVPGLAGRTALVSGSPRFVAEARALLRAAGARRVRTDAFAGY